MKRQLTTLFIQLLIFTGSISGQSAHFVTQPSQLNDPQFAEWITHPHSPEKNYGVYYFRKSFHLPDLPAQFIIHVSADNKYRLYVNGEMVCQGPATGDLNNWNYETIDIADYLKDGENLISAQVWNMGSHKGARQVSYQTAFILQGDSKSSQAINSNHTWKTTRDDGYQPINHSSQQVGGGYIAGATDSLVAAKHPWNWEKPEFDDSQWHRAKELGKGNNKGLNTWKGTRWLLQERPLPFFEQYKERTPKVLKVKGLKSPHIITSRNFSFTVPPNTKATLLLDNETLTMGYPVIKTSGGDGSKVKIRYQEALFDDNNQKKNRNNWKNKHMKGYYDVFICDGGPNRTFKPLWIRVFRYVLIEITTQAEPLKIDDFHNIFTAYPFREKASFETDRENLDQIWEVSWRTVRLCALDTYMDCPYYEQLQYIGDTRIQALISMYAAGDDRLVKNAIDQFYNSMQPMGLTKSSHPQEDTQIIPPFSLLYISMIHDYFMLRDDPQFIKQYLPGIRFILDWFVNRIDEDGMLGPLPYWNHVDGGTREFKAGSPPGIEEGGSAHLSLLLAYTINHAVELFNYFEKKCDAEVYGNIAQKLLKATKEKCYDSKKGLFAETPEKSLFSQHTNAMAILAGAAEDNQAKAVAEKMIRDSSLAQATLYFKFYVFQALKEVGMGGLIPDRLKKWEAFLKKGFTTFPEHGIESRSDCHAWAAHPIYDFLNITAGVSSASPGFKTVTIVPQPGPLKKIKARTFHPYGEIITSYTKQDNGDFICRITLPARLTGKLEWKGKSYQLSPGDNHFTLE
jgi:hypothetical protein